MIEAFSIHETILRSVSLLLRPCAARPCEGDDDCLDQDYCVKSLCSPALGHCVYTPPPPP